MTVYTRDVIFNELDRLHCENTNDVLDDNNVKLPSISYCNTESDANHQSNVRRSVRDKRAPNRFGECVYLSDDLHEPKTVEEAPASPESKFWKEAMQKEINSINENNVWTLTKPLVDQTHIKSKWVFKKKFASDGKLSCYKARLVAQGFSQIHGINYDETFAPVVRFESVRTLLSLACKKNHKLD